MCYLDISPYISALYNIVHYMGVQTEDTAQGTINCKASSDYRTHYKKNVNVLGPSLVPLVPIVAL